jgi:pilus assembly protein CpaB
MQRERNLLFIILAFLFALIATGGIYYYFQNYEDKIIKESGLTESVVATNIELKAGTEIKEFMLTTIEWPKKKLHPHHVLNKNDIIGKVVKSTIAKNMPVMKAYLAEKGANISYFVPENMRAMTIHFGKDGTDSSLVHPGTFVDVLATFKDRGMSPFTKTILQNVKVIAVNGQSEEKFELKDDVTVTDVTILVRPHDTETLALAKSQASLQIVIRNQNDSEEMERKGIDAETLLFGPKKDDDSKSEIDQKRFELFNPMPVQKRPITIIRGTDVQEVRL